MKIFSTYIVDLVCKSVTFTNIIRGHAHGLGLRRYLATNLRERQKISFKRTPNQYLQPVTNDFCECRFHLIASKVL